MCSNWLLDATSAHLFLPLTHIPHAPPHFTISKQLQNSEVTSTGEGRGHLWEPFWVSHPVNLSPPCSLRQIFSSQAPALFLREGCKEICLKPLKKGKGKALWGQWRHGSPVCWLQCLCFGCKSTKTTLCILRRFRNCMLYLFMKQRQQKTVLKLHIYF